jgi:transcription-repair coupling factor (superfamily II helicase)
LGSEEAIALVEDFLTQFDELKKKKEGEAATDVAN